MTDKLLVIVSSGMEAKDKALTGMMFAVNAKKFKHLEEVVLMFFGPSEKLISNEPEDGKFGKLLRDAMELGMTPIACKGISDGEQISDNLKKMGFELEYVASTISAYIKKDYQVLVF